MVNDKSNSYMLATNEITVAVRGNMVQMKSGWIIKNGTIMHLDEDQSRIKFLGVFLLCGEKDYLVSVSESLVQNTDDMIKVFQLTGNKELVEMSASESETLLSDETGYVIHVLPSDCFADDCYMELPTWWYEIMERIRTDSGTTYIDELMEYLLCKSKFGKPISRMPEYSKWVFLYSLNWLYVYTNRAKKDGNFLNERFPGFLTMNTETGGVYTLPTQRKLLDPLIKSKKSGYVYNPYLYSDDFLIDEMNAVSQEALLQDYILCKKRTNNITDISIDFSQPDTQKCYVINFDLNKLIDDVCSTFGVEQGEELQITCLNAKNVLFLGRTSLKIDRDNTIITGEMCFSGATFEGPFYLKGISLAPAGEGNALREMTIIDFRNAAFKSQASFRGLRIAASNTSFIISYEDARFEDGVDFVSCDFASSDIYFFQSVIGDYTVDHVVKYGEERRKLAFSFFDCRFNEKASMYCSQMEVNNCNVLFEKIPYLPITDLQFIPVQHTDEDGFRISQCPNSRLTISNVEISSVLKIANVCELILKNTHNFGRIVSGEEWGNVMEWDAYRQCSKLGIGKTAIKSPLLQAVYNYRCEQVSNHEKMKYEDRISLGADKARSFIILKENYENTGDYEDADMAFILYMEHKSDMDACERASLIPKGNYNRQVNLKKGKKWEKRARHRAQNFVYWFLYSVGKYGISPTRVLSALLVLIMTFTIGYTMLAYYDPQNSFSLANTLSAQWSYDGVHYRSQFGASLIYSVENVIPFVSQFEPIGVFTIILTVIENAIGSFLVGYFSVAVIRKTLRS